MGMTVSTTVVIIVKTTIPVTGKLVIATQDATQDTQTVTVAKVCIFNHPDNQEFIGNIVQQEINLLLLLKRPGMLCLLDIFETV